MKFETDDAVDANLGKWVLEHVQTCKLWVDPDVKILEDGVISYSFTPTLKGIVTKIHCKCGGVGDVTNYEEDA